MHLLTAWAGAAGGCLCLAAHLPGRLRSWGPHAIALTVMLTMLLPGSTAVSWAAAGAVAAAALWVALAAPPNTGCAASVLDLAMMSLITGCAAASGGALSPEGATASMPMPSMPMPAASMPSASVSSHSLGPGFVLLLIACWTVARSALRLGFLFAGRPAPARPRTVRTRLGDLGSAAMILGMAAMLL